MADELVEPQETKVPDQAEMFRQGATPEPEPVPVPEPTPQPEPVPEPVAEPELPPVEPDWLNVPQETSTPQAPPQQYYEPPPQYYEPPPPQYPQQPQVPPQPVGVDAALQTFVDQPIDFVRQVVRDENAQSVAPLAQQQQQVANMTAMLMNNYVTEGVTQADASVRRAYEVFNRDATFRADKEMQNTIQGTLQGMKQRAEHEARTTGNFAPLRALANLDESDMEATLAYMKAKAGKQSPGVAPLQVEGATVESSRSAVAEQGVELSADEEEAAARLGKGGRQRLIEAKIEQAKHDDLEWK